MNTADFDQRLSGLPDPVHQSGFYEHVPLKRALAWVIDGVITFGLTCLASLMTFGLGFFIFFALWLMVSFVYRLGTITSTSATPGMWVLSIEFRTERGQPFDGLTAVLHTLGTMILFGTLIQVISAILMLVTARGQGVMDLILGTTAVRKRARW